MRLELIELAVIEAVTEVKQPVPVALVFLLSDSHQVVGEYPDLPTSASPEDYDARDVVNSVFVPEREVLELESPEQEVIDPVVLAASIIRADVDILAL